jgi:Tol biopolymer transport system component
VDRGGNATPLAKTRRSYTRPRLSPDGKRLVVAVGTLTMADVWLLDTGRSVLTRMTFEGGVRPIWTPDGTRIVFASSRVAAEGFDIFWKPANGSGAAEQLTAGAYRIPDSISPDGKFLLFRQENSETEADIGVTSFEEEREPEILLGTPYRELHATISPDGRWFAYTSDESGRPEVYVQSFPELGGKLQVSAEGGGEPVWSRDGKELFYRSGDKMMAARIATEPELAAERPVVLFEGAYELSGGGVTSNYDVAPDGRFVMIRGEQDARPTEQRINVVLNWFEELTARVPTDE